MGKQTPSQTVGPFFAYGLTPEQYDYAYRSIGTGVIAKETTEGERIRIVGRVLDGEGRPVPDAMVEVWQANADGRYNHPADGRRDNRLDPDFKGFGRCGTGTRADACFVFETVKPGPVGDGQAPHLNVIVMARGMTSHAFTRIYFSDESEANASDRVLAQVEPERRGTLIAERHEAAAGTVYRLDIRLQGEGETVFFDA
jgi:protocatechuate 3,4-dioxygenase, alpha subunit